MHATGATPDQTRRRALGRAALLLAGAAAAVFAFWHFRVVSPIRWRMLTAQNYDAFVYYYPTFNYAFADLAQRGLPFWNPYQHAGSPFFATGQHLLLYPLNALFLLLPTASAIAGTTLLHLVLALAFTYFLARTIGLCAGAAATAAVAFAFSAAMAVLIVLPHHLYGAVWIPAQLALVYRVVRGTRRGLAAVAFGVASAAQYLGGYPMFSLFSVYACAAYAVWLLAGLRRDGAAGATLGRAAGWLVVAGLLAAALSAPQLLPAAELAARSPRRIAAMQIADIDPHYRHTQPLQTLSAALFPGRDAVLYRPLPHVGLAALVLACVAALHRARRRDAIFYLLLTVVSGLLAFGRHTPLFALYFHLPTADWFRIPNRFFILTALGLAMLAGIGADHVLRRTAQSARVAVAALLVAAVYASLFITFINRAALPEITPYLHVLPPRAVAFLRQHQGYDRTYVPPPGLGRGLRAPSKAGMLHRLYVVGDRENVYPHRFSQYVDRTADPQARLMIDAVRTQMLGAEANPVPQGEFAVHSASPNWRLLDLLGTRWIVTGPGATFERGHGDHTFRTAWSAGDYTIYENPAALPRAFIVHRVEVIDDSTRVLDRLVEASFDPRTTVILERQSPHRVQPPAADAAPSEAHIVAYAPHEVEILARSSAPGFLILTDQDYPGWSAEVDGVAVPIERADYLFRAVALPAGEHRVRFRFTPRAFQIGSAIAATAVGALGVAALFAWRARRRRGAP